MKLLSIKRNILFATTFFVALPFVAFAQETYIPLAPIPGVRYEIGNIPDVVNNLYKVLIAIGAVIAVIRIAWAGVRYTTSDVVTRKSEARDDIRNVLIGLLILVSPALVLGLINKDILDLNIFSFKMSSTLNVPTSSGDNTSFELEEGQVAHICELNINSNYDRDLTRCNENCNDVDGELHPQGNDAVCVYEPEIEVESVAEKREVRCTVQAFVTLESCEQRCGEISQGFGVLNSDNLENRGYVTCNYLVTQTRTRHHLMDEVGADLNSSDTEDVFVNGYDYYDNYDNYRRYYSDEPSDFYLDMDDGRG